MDRTLNLSDLYELLHETLLTTEQVKEVLKRDCDEATFVLKPWQVKTIVKNQESVCNCKKVANENETEEIAAGIGKAIILAQELREKLKLNVASKKKTRKDTIENIYLSNSTSVSDRKKVSRNNVAIQKVNIAKSSICIKSTVFQNDKVTSVSMKKSSSSKSVGDTKRSNTTDKMQSKMFHTKVATKCKTEKNFILRNKLNVKKINLENKLQIGGCNSNDTLQNPRKSLPPGTSAAELSNLIREMARRSTESALFSSSDNNKANCSLHGDNACQSVQERIVAIDVVEALHYLDVPNEIVKILKTYYVFLKTEADNLNIKKDKNRKFVGVFLKEFEAMNTTMQDYLLQESHLLKVVAESISVFSNTFNEDLDLTLLDGMKNTLVELETAMKFYNIKNIAEPVIEKLSYNFSLATGWMLNGIWNTFCMEHFENFSKLYNIKYCNKRQLLLLYEAIQKLQRIEYLNRLIRIILCNIIPTVKSNIDSMSAEYVRAYKTMFILYQGLNPELPVLVSTDN